MNNQRRRSSAGIVFAALLSSANIVNSAPTPFHAGGDAPQASATAFASAIPTFADPFAHHGKRAGSFAFHESHRQRKRDLQDGVLAFEAAVDPTDCTPATTSANDISAMFYQGGAGYKVSLCPSTTYELDDTITLWHQDQELSTAGYPVDDTRATLLVTGQDQAVAVFIGCDDCAGASVRNIQINGNRPAMGRMEKGAALVETGGTAGNQTIENCHIFEPRGWSALHVAEGPELACEGVKILSNEIGPAGNAPNSAKQYKRDMSAYAEYMFTPTHQLAARAIVNPGQWADGVSLSCRNSEVSGNTITDATDGSVVIFGSPGSAVHNNTILARERVALGGINMVDYNPWGGDYSDVVVSENLIRTEGSMIKVGVAIGGMTWGSDNSTALQTKNGKVVNNTFESGDGYFGYGISVAGHQNIYTSGNSFDAAKFNMAPSEACIPHLMPPPAQSLVRDPDTSYGAFQRITNPSTLAFLVCVMPTQYASSNVIKRKEVLEDKASQPIEYSIHEVENIPPPAARTIAQVRKSIVGFAKNETASSAFKRSKREKPWFGGLDAMGRLAFDKRNVLQQDRVFA